MVLDCESAGGKTINVGFSGCTVALNVTLFGPLLIAKVKPNGCTRRRCQGSNSYPQNWRSEVDMLFRKYSLASYVT